MRLLTALALLVLTLGILLGSLAIQNREEKIYHQPKAGGTCASLGGRCGRTQDLLVCAHSGGENLGEEDCPVIDGFGFCCSRDWSLPGPVANAAVTPTTEPAVSANPLPLPTLPPRPTPPRPRLPSPTSLPDRRLPFEEFLLTVTPIKTALGQLLAPRIVNFVASDTLIDDQDVRFAMENYMQPVVPSEVGDAPRKLDAAVFSYLLSIYGFVIPTEP